MPRPVEKGEAGRYRRGVSARWGRRLLFQRSDRPDRRREFPIVKDTTPNMMNPRLYTTSYNKPQGQQFDDTAVLSFIKLQYT